MSDSVQPHRRQPTRLLCPWDSPGKNTGVSCHFLLQCMKVKVKSFSRCWLFSPMNCSLPGSSVHGILQARVLEWGAIAFTKHSLSAFYMLHSMLDDFPAYRQAGTLYSAMLLCYTLFLKSETLGYWWTYLPGSNGDGHSGRTRGLDELRE